jgi:hypothetical protein
MAKIGSTNNHLVQVGFMILTEEHIGIKVTRPNWNKGNYFVPDRVVSGVGAYGLPGDVTGTTYQDGNIITNDGWCNRDRWELYQEPHQEAKPDPKDYSLEEAIRSGKPFRATCDRSDLWCYVNSRGAVVVHDSSGEELECPISLAWLTQRYVLKKDPKKVEVTKEQLVAIMIKDGFSGVHICAQQYLQHLIKELGLDE